MNWRGIFWKTDTGEQHPVGIYRAQKRPAMQAFLIYRNVLRLMRPGQEFVRLHFQQTTQGALELEVQATAGVEVF